MYLLSLTILLISQHGFLNSNAQQIAADLLASQYNLATSTSFPFPTVTQSPTDAQSLLVSQWSLGKGRIQDNPDNIAFVADPYPNGKVAGDSDQAFFSGPVLQVTYPAGSYSHDTGGTQFYNLWNNTDESTFGTMIVSYEVAFEQGFDWVKGGKLPGLRGGLNSTGCSGGNQATGNDCFSSRVMWRKNADGEVYAYIPTSNDLCNASKVICNSDFGISFQRGSLGFVSGQWNRITMLVRLNNPHDVANGNIMLYYNDLLAISQQGLQIRSSSNVSINGLYFSTFFGGSDTSWATPNTTHTYFRNIRLWGSSAPSNLTGTKIKSATPLNHSLMSLPTAMFLASMGLLAAFL